MSIYKRGGNWYIDFTFKGQRIRESIGPSRKGAEKVIAKKKAEIAENKFLDVRKDPDPITFHEFAKEYLAWSKANKKPLTVRCEIFFVREFEEEFGSTNIQEITTWQIEKWKVKKKEHLKPASINREISLLKHMFTKAAEWGKVKENPTIRVKCLKCNNKRVRFLMPDEVHRLLSNCADYLKPIVIAAVHTGVRKGEILGLKWEQVDFHHRIISLFDTKNHEGRDIPMDETVKVLLTGMEKKNTHVFLKEGQPLKFVDVSFKTAVRKSGIEDFHFHDLRHTFASNLVMQEGVELNDVRELLGHKNMSMTFRYAHLSPKHKTRVINILDRVMSQNPPQSQIQEKVVSLRA
jgi:integrase